MLTQSDVALPRFLHLHCYAGLEGGHRTSFVVKVDLLFFVYCFHHLYSLQFRLQNGLTNPEHQLNLSPFQRTCLGLNHHLKIYSRLLVNIYSNGHFYNFLWPVWISNLYTKWAVYHTTTHPCVVSAYSILSINILPSHFVKIILLQAPLFQS